MSYMRGVRQRATDLEERRKSRANNAQLGHFVSRWKEQTGPRSMQMARHYSRALNNMYGVCISTNAIRLFMRRWFQ